jgi:hypothetical protein
VEYLHEESLTQDDAVEGLLALLDGEFVLIDFRLAVALLDLHLALGHMVLQHVVLPLHLSLPLLLLMPAVDLRSAVHVLSEVVLVLLLLFVLGVVGVFVGAGILMG